MGEGNASVADRRLVQRERRYSEPSGHRTLPVNVTRHTHEIDKPCHKHKDYDLVINTKITISG